MKTIKNANPLMIALFLSATPIPVFMMSCGWHAWRLGVLMSMFCVMAYCLAREPIFEYYHARKMKKRKQECDGGCGELFGAAEIIPASGDYWYCPECFEKYMRGEL